MSWAAKSDEELAFKAQTGDLDAEAALVDRYIKKAELIVRDFPVPGLDFDDRVSEARWGLIKAVRNFEWGMDCSFATFAKNCMKRALIDVYRRQTKDGNVPRALLVSIESDPDEEGSIADCMVSTSDTEAAALARMTAHNLPEQVVGAIEEAVVMAAAGKASVGGNLRKSLLGYTRSVYGAAFAADMAEMLGSANGQPVLIGLGPPRGSDRARGEAERIASEYADLCRTVIYDAFDGHDAPTVRNRLIERGIVLDRSVVAGVKAAVSEVASLLSVAT